MGTYWSFEGDLPYLAGDGFNISSEEPEERKVPKVLEETWFVLDSEPNMDDIYDDSLVKQFEEGLGIFPFKTFEDEEKRIFEARFEFPKYGEDFQYPEAKIEDVENPLGFIDFMTGIPLDCIEMLVMVGEYSTVPEALAAAKSVQPGDGAAAAPVPEEFFTWQEDMILMNYTAIAQGGVEWMAKNLSGESEPVSHWWLRYNFNGDGKKWPVPGEFFGLGVRLMPDLPWGSQDSSPFLYSGNWMDGIYYTSAVITEVIDPTDAVPYSTYKAKWRKDEVTVNPSDFALYKVGDKVTILKDVATEKMTQLWKDDDMKFFGGKEDIAPEDITWMICPITFYGLETPGGG